MKWYDLADAEINWLKECAQTAPDPLIKSWFEVLVQMGHRRKEIPIGSCHNEEHQCTCGDPDCDNSKNEDALNRSYFYSDTADIVAMSSLGYMLGNPDDGTVRSDEINELRRMGSKDQMCIVSTESRARELILVSRHPLRKKLQPVEITYGHGYSLIVNRGCFLDGPTVKRLLFLKKYSVLVRVMGEHPESPTIEKQVLELANEFGDKGKLLLHLMTDMGIAASFDIETTRS